MELPVAIITFRLFLRLLLGLILLSVGLSKLAHPRRFQHSIQDYQLLPSSLESTVAFLLILSFVIPLAELLAGLGLISGFLLVPATFLALALFVIFSGAIIINLLRGRTDLSCHCGGAVGNHTISWWLVGRNCLLMIGLLFLLMTPPDVFTVASLLHSPSLLSSVLVSTALPVAVLVGTVLAALVLLNCARVLRRS